MVFTDASHDTIPEKHTSLASPADSLAHTPSSEDAKELFSPGWRILVVDDNRDAAASLSILLQLFGHRTRVAHDGPQALTEAEAFQPDAILLDIGLPGLDGWQVARRIRATAWGRDTVLLALTGGDRALDRQQSRDAGFDAHLVKPVQAEALLRKLDDLLSAGAMGRQRSRTAAIAAQRR